VELSGRGIETVCRQTGIQEELHRTKARRDALSKMRATVFSWLISRKSAEPQQGMLQRLSFTGNFVQSLNTAIPPFAD
jgi:hypothetical protein